MGNDILLVLTERVYRNEEISAYLESISEPPFKLEKLPISFSKDSFFINEFKAMEILLKKPLKKYRCVVIGCFFDPCVEFLRMKRYRVIGCGEASMMLASLLEKDFGVISCFKGAVSRVKLLVKRLGLMERFVGISVVNEEEESLIKGGQKLIERGADSLIVAHLSSLKLLNFLSGYFKNVRVIEPLKAGLVLANAMF